MEESYFPPQVFGDDPSLHAVIARRYRRNLLAFGEESFFVSAYAEQREAYRFLWLRTFDHPLLFRLDMGSDGSGLLTYKERNGNVIELEGEDGEEPMDLALDGSVTVSNESVLSFRTALRQSSYWVLPSWKDSAALDGAGWVLEAVDRGIYHVVSRWGGGEIRNVALMLVKLSRLKVEAVY